MKEKPPCLFELSVNVNCVGSVHDQCGNCESRRQHNMNAVIPSVPVKGEEKAQQHDTNVALSDDEMLERISHQFYPFEANSNLSDEINEYAKNGNDHLRRAFIKGYNTHALTSANLVELERVIEIIEKNLAFRVNERKNLITQIKQLKQVKE